MFERLFKFFYYRYLHNFIELDEDKVSIGLWNGKLELHDVKIKPDALQNLRIPITIEESMSIIRLLS